MGEPVGADLAASGRGDPTEARSRRRCAAQAETDGHPPGAAAPGRPQIGPRRPPQRLRSASSTPGWARRCPRRTPLLPAEPVAVLLHQCSRRDRAAAVAGEEAHHTLASHLQVGDLASRPGSPAKSPAGVTSAFFGAGADRRGEARWRRWAPRLWLSPARVTAQARWRSAGRRPGRGHDRRIDRRDDMAQRLRT